MDKLCKIRDLQRTVNRFEAALTAAHGICLNEGMALCSLYPAGKLSSGQLAQMTGLSASNMSKVLCSLERKGLVERTLGEGDKRRMYFSLTRKGRLLLDSVDCQALIPPGFPETIFS